MSGFAAYEYVHKDNVLEWLDYYKDDKERCLDLIFRTSRLSEYQFNKLVLAYCNERPDFKKYLEEKRYEKGMVVPVSKLIEKIAQEIPEERIEYYRNEKIIEALFMNQDATLDDYRYAYSILLIVTNPLNLYKSHKKAHSIMSNPEYTDSEKKKMLIGGGYDEFFVETLFL